MKTLEKDITKVKLDSVGALGALTAIVAQSFMPAEGDLKETAKMRLDFAKGKAVNIWASFSGLSISKVRSAIINYNQGLLEGKRQEGCTDLMVLIDKYGV